MTRNDILQYVQTIYHTQPDYPFRTAPDTAILRHEKSRKWYAAILVVKRKILGLTGDKSIDVLNVKCDPMLTGMFRMKNGILPAYHMNKEHWITILLDGSVPFAEIYDLIDDSYNITAS